MTAFTRAALRRKPARRIAVVGLIATGSLFLAACGGDGDDMSGMDHGSSSSASATATSQAAGSAEQGKDFNDADVAFAQMMIPHHEQALEMAKLADGRASDAEVKDIAQKIENAQDPEIKTMKGWLKAWGQPTQMESMPGMDHGGHGSGDGMMSEADMEELKGMKGTEFDKAFAEMMIDHHNGAISMAKDEQKNGKYAEAKKMADDIVKGQSAEVEQLQSTLDRL
ncbi:DUF305 domain-containing protein [Streptomyces anthocyanicus]|uniref:Multicopper oxidase n=1 Tax=Streptomyces lividans 1326 TaxID=1200984 RepID=A0A7U9DRN5_STRLI|nr:MULTISPECIES: DUF305 domain-containing protein [Streptomyces]EOY45788.1 Multicopper oxidase [Streptomyces lividans 1326]KKD12274.1 hypothetical protein TR66_26650 [Streptomyces sp. WM6391]